MREKRDLKFRAWLYIDGTMQYESLYGAEKFGGRDCEIMQYTGFKDKNGKEIYEGDIIVMTGFPEEKEIVEFRECYGGFYPFTYCNGDPSWCGKNPRNSEAWDVIGNIYENEDLLKM